MEQMDKVPGAGDGQRFALTSERAREREVFRHLQPWLETYRHGEIAQPSPFPADVPAELPKPKPCRDTTLAAFAQLCALRLDAHRCLVSLISSSTEYVLVESTRTISLQYDQVDDVRDRLWLGTRSLPRDDGVNVSALDAWRRAQGIRKAPESDDFYFTEKLSPHACVVSDLRNHPDYGARPFTRHCPTARFYASIPLRTARGLVLGAVTVLDGRPRYGISATELGLMEDIADTITGHLDDVIVRVVRQRSERLIQGLSLFNSGKTSLRAWWMRQEESRLSNTGRHAPKELSPTDRLTRMDEEFGRRDAQDDEHSSPSRRRNRDASARSRTDSTGTRLAKRKSATATDSTSRQTPDPSSVPVEGNPTHSNPPRKRLIPLKQSRSRVTDDPDHFDLPAASAQAYARASNLIREALGCEGVVLLNAGALRNFGRPSVVNKNGSTSSHTSGDENPPAEDTLCSVQGFSTRNKDSLSKSRASALRFDLRENLLIRLVKRYPHGQVFNFGDGGSIHSSSGDDVTMGSSEDFQPNDPQRRPRVGQVLADTIPGVRSVAFYPLWDDNQERYRSCIFVWSITPMRFFSIPEDLTYLSAWAHSLVAELSRLEMLAADRAKGTFISSVSHELRSPLHGVLAGVELLSDTDLTAFQKEMTQTISMAGSTLLDTINHILDYSKISTFTRAQKRARTTLDKSRHRSGGSADPHEMGVRFDIDLARLTEEVVETIISARRHERRVANHVQSPEESSVDQQRLLHPRSSDQDLSVTLNIAPRQSWVVELQPGGWSRIVSNLVGNALKYTVKGKVTIGLAAGEYARQLDGQDRFKVTLTVEDTGIGMSDQFLSHHLYTPFKQEDSHSTGTGLGLSIVKSIAEDLGATLNIDSKVGEGTRATLHLWTAFSHEANKGSGGQKGEAILDAPRSLPCSHAHLFSPRSKVATDLHPSSDLTAEERNFMDSAKVWLKCDVSTGPVSPSPTSTLHAIAERYLPAFLQGLDGFSSITNEGSGVANLLVLATSMEEARLHQSLEDDRLRPIFLQQPIGPRKLFRAVTTHDTQDNTKSEKSESGVDTANPQQPKGSASSATNPDNSKRGKDATRSDSPAQTGGNKLLLVEDNAINMKLLVAFARKLNFDYHCATHGREALEAYAAAPRAFSVVFMDMQMPVMDGFTATARIREEESRRGLPAVPIVALTGVTNAEAKQRAFDSGVNDYLSKPVKMKELEALVGSLGALRVEEDGEEEEGERLN